MSAQQKQDDARRMEVFLDAGIPHFAGANLAVKPNLQPLVSSQWRSMNTQFIEERAILVRVCNENADGLVFDGHVSVISVWGKSSRNKKKPKKRKGFRLHMRGMQAHHVEAVIGKCRLQRQHGVDGFRVDIGQVHARHPGRDGSPDHFRSVAVEF